MPKYGATTPATTTTRRVLRTTDVTYRLNIFRWPGRHQWSITGGQRAGGHPGRQVLAKLRLRSNIRVITRNYTEHVDGLAEAGSPTTTNIAATSFSSFFFFFSSSSFAISFFTAITSSSSTYYFVFAASPSFSRLRSRYRGLSSSSASTSSAPVNPSVPLLRLPAAFTRSLLGHDRERGVLVPLPPPPPSPPPSLPVAPSSLFCMRFSARGSRLSLSSLGLRNFRKLLCNNR